MKYYFIVNSSYKQVKHDHHYHFTTTRALNLETEIISLDKTNDDHSVYKILEELPFSLTKICPLKNSANSKTSSGILKSR